MMLTDEQIAEVVAFDRRVRGGYKRRNGRKMPRITNRYNYIVPCNSTVKSLAEVLGCETPDIPKEVCIVNVAVKPGYDDVPVVREVSWMWPETGRIKMSHSEYRGLAGWTVDWAWKDLHRRKNEPETPWRRARFCTGVTGEYTYRYGNYGLCRTQDRTINPEALQETRYKYCQYSDKAPCCTGLMEWLSLYRQEPKVELLAKAKLFCFINPAGLKALKDKRIFQWAKDNMKMLRRHKFAPIKYILWAARHGTTLEGARRHYDLVHDLCYELDSVRWHLKYPEYPGRERAGFKLKIDYERLAGLLKKWHVDGYEYGRYIQHAFDAGLDLKNDGTLYPPTRGGRKTFMARLEELEAECARLEEIRERAERKRRKAEEKAEREWIAKTMKVRFEEIEAFQKSLRRTATLRGCGYTLVLAKTQKELRTEGRRMGNCVGNGTYGRGIVTGDKLIVMLGLGGKSYCDIEIDRRNWRVNQCYLKGNTTPPEEVCEFADRIAAFLKEEHKRHRKAGLFNVPRRKAA